MSLTYTDWKPLRSIRVGIPQRTLRRWCEAGLIRAQKFGRLWYVHLPTLLRQKGFESLAESIYRPQRHNGF